MSRENNAPEDGFFAGFSDQLVALHALAGNPDAFAQARRALLEDYFRRVDADRREHVQALQRQIDMEAAVMLNPDRMVKHLLGQIDDQIAAFEAIAKRQMDGIVQRRE